VGSGCRRSRPLPCAGRAVHPVAAVQSEYSLWTRQPELGMLQACAELGTTFVAFSPVGRGIFADRFPDPTARSARGLPGGQPAFHRTELHRQHCRHRSVPGLVPRAGLVDIRRRGGLDPASGRTRLPIPGTRSATHIRELAQAAEIALTPDDLADIARLLPPGFAHGARYADAQWPGVEQYC
jgi:aryl-alcohol dehydrogenase-like predicted oxidoreductase